MSHYNLPESGMIGENYSIGDEEGPRYCAVGIGLQRGLREVGAAESARHHKNIGELTLLTDMAM